MLALQDAQLVWPGKLTRSPVIIESISLQYVIQKGELRTMGENRLVISNRRPADTAFVSLYSCILLHILTLI